MNSRLSLLRSNFCPLTQSSRSLVHPFVKASAATSRGFASHQSLWEAQAIESSSEAGANSFIGDEPSPSISKGKELGRLKRHVNQMEGDGSLSEEEAAGLRNYIQHIRSKVPVDENAVESAEKADPFPWPQDFDISPLIVTPERDLNEPEFDKNTHRLRMFSDYSKKYINIPNIWLRDQCPCNDCMHRVTRQRLFDVSSLPKDLQIKWAIVGKDRIHVMWSDKHQSFYSVNRLVNAGLGSKTEPFVTREKTQLWTASIKSKPPTISYEDVMSTNGVAKWLALVKEFGFAYVDGCPPTPEATKELLEQIAFIRVTHYGGFWDFTSDLAKADTAYTELALDAHTDNTYFSDPAGLQLFHLLSHTDGKGGASLLVDGFKAAKILREEHPKAYHILSTVGVRSHASGNRDISIQPYQAFPVLLHNYGRGSRELVQVRWNWSDRAGLDLPVEETERWYDAADKWSSILSRPEMQYWEQLKPGKPLIFDNWRVMHGRSAFTGKRRMCGGYINRDDWISRHRMANYGRSKVLRALGVQ